MNVILTLLIASNIILTAACVQLRRKQLASWRAARSLQSELVREDSLRRMEGVLADIAARESMVPVDVSLSELIGAGR